MTTAGGQIQPKHHIPAGSYYASGPKPMLLEAFLGTCVGVAAIDSTAGCGGLIHLLLSEQTAPDSTFQPEKYASTGIPLFLSALYELGASRENLMVHMAGGALMGPVSDQDVSLDIGGRTADVATRILSAEGIAIERLETGGFHACTMGLNMNTWEVTIRPAGSEKVFSGASVTLPSPEQIHQAIEHIQPIPQVALKILRMMEQDNYNILDIANEVRKDQVISARTLKLCNSPLYAKTEKIESLDHALALLGRDLFLKSVVSAAVRQYFNQTGSGYSLCKGGLYHHAVGTAMIAEKLAGQSKGVPPSIAYTAGLLHDIGKVVLDQYIARGYPLFYRDLQHEKNFLEIEKDALGVDHTEVGRQLADMWNFPDTLASMIRHHHYPENDTITPKLTHIIYLADLLMSRFHTDYELERMNTDRFAQRLAKVGFQLSQLSYVVDLMPNTINEMDSG